jgi:NAD-dependent SIR2 family protein deacetylase
LSPVQTKPVLFCVQGLPEEFHSAIAADKEHVDLLIVIGSSLKVKTTMLLRWGFSLVLFTGTAFIVQVIPDPVLARSDPL